MLPTIVPTTLTWTPGSGWPERSSVTVPVSVPKNDAGLTDTVEESPREGSANAASGAARESAAMVSSSFADVRLWSTGIGISQLGGCGEDACNDGNTTKRRGVRVTLR